LILVNTNCFTVLTGGATAACLDASKLKFVALAGMLAKAIVKPINNRQTFITLYL
jgi:hypothetical protein